MKVKWIHRLLLITGQAPQHMKQSTPARTWSCTMYNQINLVHIIVGKGVRQRVNSAY